MFIALVEIFDQRRSEERNPTRLQLASTFPLLRTPREGFCSSSYKHATPNGVKPVTLFSQRRKLMDGSDPTYKEIGLRNLGIDLSHSPYRAVVLTRNPPVCVSCIC